MVYNYVVWEACPTPQIEADNIYMQCTGCDDWDTYDASNTIVPAALSKWELI